MTDPLHLPYWAAISSFNPCAARLILFTDWNCFHQPMFTLINLKRAVQPRGGRNALFHTITCRSDLNSGMLSFNSERFGSITPALLPPHPTCRIKSLVQWQLRSNALQVSRMTTGNVSLK